MPAANPLHPIPHPPRQPLLGNLLSIRSTSPTQDMAALVRQLGPVYWLDMPGLKLIIVGRAALAEEVCDPTRFDKCTIGTLRRLRPLSHGLFTSDTQEATWAKPHGILLPNFSQRAMRGYHPMMLDIAQQLVAKWDRLNPDDEVDVVRDMTALTLDTIGLCGFGYRFNSFYRQDFHPFVDAMTRSLETVQRRRGLPLERWWLRRPMAQMDADVAYMHGMVGRIVRERRASGLGIAEQPDLLSYMLAGVDKASGEGLDDAQIRDECIEFLIAGHETTSNLLSFALVELLAHPEVLARARDEVDAVLGTDPTVPASYAQVNQLVYVQQVLKEALRLYPPAPAIGLQARADTTIGGDTAYPIPRRALVILNVLALHRDPAVWGPQPERFDPEHFSRAAEAQRPAHAYKPFGNGQRACIGRQFAMQEATLVLGMILQRFELINHQGYTLRIREALTIKPEGLRIQVRRRPAGAGPAAAVGAAHRGLAVLAAGAPMAGASSGQAASLGPDAQPAVLPDDRGPAVPAHGLPLLVLHGSNLGTAEDLARQLARDGTARGFDVRVAALDEVVDGLPGAGAVLVVCASYNGAPPDNAQQFCAALPHASTLATALPFAVFGCGNRDWATTYQAVPRLLDEGLARRGGQRVLARGEGDARADMAGAFQAWSQALWPALGQALGLTLADPDTADAPPRVRVQVLPGLASTVPPGPLPSRLGATLALTVLRNDELQQAPPDGPAERSTRHLVLGLPAGVAYAAGDHLGIQPVNPPALVARALQRLGLGGDEQVMLHDGGGAPAHLPLGQPVTLRRLLAEAVELQAVATRRQIAALHPHTRCPHTGAALQALAGTDAAAAARYQAEVLLPRRSLLDLLEAWPAIEVPLATLLGLWPALAPRHYSVASSPLADPRRCSLTVAVVDGPARSGQGRYQGVCSTFLRDAQPGQVLHGRFKPSAPGFGLPDDALRPLIMVGPGTGLAPFRGFVQQRAVLRQQGQALGEALLFFGCRHPAQDFLFADELQAWHDQGLVQLHTAFSRQGPSKVYVQHLLQAQAAGVWRLLQAGAVVYVCGDASAMEPAVRQTLRQIAQDQGAPAGWLDALVQARRYVLDVWAGG